MDIQFIQFNDTIPFSGVSLIEGFMPVSIRITGPDLTSAISVRVNEAVSPSFVVANATTILAQVPSSELARVISSVVVVSSEFNAKVSSVLEFSLGPNPKTVTGVQALIQSYLKMLLTTPGQDAFAPSIGGGVQKMIGGNFGSEALKGLVAAFALAIGRTTEQFIALQSRQRRTSGSELLLNTQLLGTNFDVANTAMSIRMQMSTQSGITAITNLEL
jgi:hypothetical protein